MIRSARAFTAALVLGLGATASGCVSPDYASVHWSEAAPIVQPQATRPDGLGELDVTTAREDDVDGLVDHRGYAIYDAQGRRVESLPDFLGAHDRVRLEPGRYIVVALVDTGVFTRGLTAVQAVVVRDAITRVDVSKPARPVTTSPADQAPAAEAHLP